MDGGEVCVPDQNLEIFKLLVFLVLRITGIDIWYVPLLYVVWCGLPGLVSGTSMVDGMVDGSTIDTSSTGTFAFRKWR